MNKQNIQSCDAPRQVKYPSPRLLERSIQLFNNHIPTKNILLGLVEFPAFVLALYAGVFLRFEGIHTPTASFEFPLLPKAILFAIAMTLSMVSMGAYQRSSNRRLVPMMLRIAGAMALAVIPLTALYYMAPMLFLGRGVMALATMVSFANTLIIRVIFYKMSKAAVRPRILILGTGKNARLVSDAQEKGELDGLDILGYCAVSADSIEVRADDIVDIKHSLIDVVEGMRPDQIVVAVDERRNALPVKDILDCKMSGVSVVDLPTFFERETGKVRLDILTPSWLYLSEGFSQTLLRRIAKRLLDIVTAGTLLILAAPLMLLVACCIYVEGGFKAPVLYRQVRVGKNGVQFEILKFRSMVPDAESDGVARWADRNDSRVTRIGAFIRKARLDELPQLFNVLRGQMSIVGPRPERTQFTRQLGLAIPYYNERHRVKPGVTGWAQIRFDYGASMEDSIEKLQYDLYYTKNYSIFMDLVIILQTVEVVLWGRGAR